LKWKKRKRKKENSSTFKIKIAYDDEALSFTKGELIGIEEKDPSGNWKGTCLDPATKASLGKSGKKKKLFSLVSFYF